jgi:hypothetical protein
MNDPFINLVAVAGFIVSAAAVLGLTWRGRAKWEPDISDVPKGPQRVAGLISSVFLALLWFDAGSSVGLPPLQWVAAYSAVIALVGLLIYLFLTTVFVYELQLATSARKTKKIRIIGGLWLTRLARKRRRAGTDIQTLLAQSANKPDLVWPRPARALAQALFVIAYIGLSCGGTIALTAAALLVQARIA